MSRPLQASPSDHVEVDHIIEDIESDMDVQRRVLSHLSLQIIGTHFSKFGQVPPLDSDGFRRIPNPFNLKPIASQTITKPLHIAIPEYLHSIETLQFLGFQRAKAEEIFAHFTSLQDQNGNSTPDLVRLAGVYITAADLAAEKNAQTEGQPIEDDVARCISLVRDYMGIEFDGVKLDLIDEPDRPLFLSTVREWVLQTTVRRYHFLCRLDPIFRKFGIAIALQREEEIEEERERQENATGQLDPTVAAEEAKRKARNRKKSQAKKAAKQRRKALGAREADVKQTEGDGDGGSQDLLDQDQLAGGAEEKGEDEEE